MSGKAAGINQLLMKSDNVLSKGHKFSTAIFIAVQDNLASQPRLHDQTVDIPLPARTLLSSDKSVSIKISPCNNLATG